jgi:hypothetical protein
MSTFFLFQTPDERLADLNNWAARDHANLKLVDRLAESAQAQARKRAEALGFALDSAAAQAELDRARSTLYRSAIEGALAKNDIDTGLDLYGQAGAKLVPTDEKVLKPLIAFARERRIGREYADRLPSIDALGLPDLRQAHLKATAQNEADWLENAGQRATNQHFIDVKFGKAVRDVLIDQAELKRSVADWLARPGPDGEAQTERPPVAIWASLSVAERNEIDSALRRAPWERSGPRQRHPNATMRSPGAPLTPDPVSILPKGSPLFPWKSKEPWERGGIGINPPIPRAPEIPKGLEPFVPAPEIEPSPAPEDRPGPTGWPDDNSA